MARNPALMQEMMRNQDRALSNLEVIHAFVIMAFYSIVFNCAFVFIRACLVVLMLYKECILIFKNQ